MQMTMNMSAGYALRCKHAFRRDFSEENFHRNIPFFFYNYCTDVQEGTPGQGTGSEETPVTCTKTELQLSVSKLFEYVCLSDDDVSAGKAALDAEFPEICKKTSSDGSNDSVCDLVGFVRLMQKILCRMNACATQLPGEHYCEMGSKDVTAKGDYSALGYLWDGEPCSCSGGRRRCDVHVPSCTCAINAFTAPTS